MHHSRYGATVFALSLLAACGPTGEIDTDGDALYDAFEESIGTDIESVDTDGDGFADADEHLYYFDALDPDDFPRAGDYPRGPIPDDVAELEGIIRSFELTDQHGEQIDIHEFYGNVVLIKLSADW